MNRFTMSNLALRMSYKMSPKEIEKIIDKLDIEPANNLHAVSYESINVAATQVLIRQYESLSDYVMDMNIYISDAVNRRAQIICFPAYAGLLPVSLMPQTDKVLAALRPNPDEPINPIEVHRALSYFSDFALEAYTTTMSALAAQHGVYIMAGSTLCFDGDDLCHRSMLFNHAGELVGYQDKLSITAFEQEMGILPASEVRVFDTPLGQISLLACSDTEYFETAKIARKLGAQLLLSPSAFPNHYSPMAAAMGINMRAQETKSYGVQSVLVGDTGLGFTLEGNATFFAPNEMVKQKNGVLAKTTGAHAPELVCSFLNLDRLDMIKNPYMIDKNRDLMHNYIDRLL